MRIVAPIIVLWTLLYPLAALGDELYFKNGDHLTGQIIRMTDDKFVFKSQNAGEVTVNLSDIRTFSSEKPLEIHLKDGVTVLNQPVAIAEPNGFTIATGEPLRPQAFALSQIASINPPPKPKPKWTGNIAGSVAVVSGNTKTASYTGTVSVVRRSEKDRLSGNADIVRSEREDPDTGDKDVIENWWKLKAEYDYFFTKQLYGFVNGRYEKDTIALLDRRVVVGGGAGFQWIEKPRVSFSTNLGLASLYEKYDDPGNSTNSTTSLQAGYNLQVIPLKNLTFLHDLTYYPSLEDFSDYFLTTSAELRATMIKNLYASFRVIFDYDATPAQGRQDTDVKYLFSIGLTF
jgi:putative salt-induced outer membrane protein YdiY